MVLYVIVCVFILDLPSSFLWWGFFMSTTDLGQGSAKMLCGNYSNEGTLPREVSELLFGKDSYYDTHRGSHRPTCLAIATQQSVTPG